MKKPVWLHSDARKLPRLFDRPFELILSSPPYGGTYDYVEHHARRLAWLGLTTKKFAARELGARRRFDRAVQADHWEQEVAEMLSAMRAVLAPGGLCVVLLGDAQIGERRIGARVQLERISPAVGLEVVAWASQKRPDWSGGRPRLESLIALRGVDAPGPRQDDASED